MKTAIYFMLMISAAHAVTVDAAPRPQAAVAIRTYNYAGVANGQMSEARSEAHGSAKPVLRMPPGHRVPR